jgi:hypothetical protein
VSLQDQKGIRLMLLAILFVGLVGMGAELLFLGHVEHWTQIIPLVLIAIGLVAIVWHMKAESPSSRRMMRVTMWAFIAGGVLGIGLHYLGSAGFQKELDPSIHGFALFMKVMQSKAPPPLAPGALAYLGLLGLVYSYSFAIKGDEK